MVPLRSAKWPPQQKKKKKKKKKKKLLKSPSSQRSDFKIISPKLPKLFHYAEQKRPPELKIETEKKKQQL